MRKWTEIVKPFPDFIHGTFYPVKVRDVRRLAQPRAMEVELECLDGAQLGRRITVQLSLPLRVGSSSVHFLEACGLAVTPETRIAPRDALGTVLAVAFEKTPAGEGWQAVDFRRLSEGGSHEPV